MEEPVTPTIPLLSREREESVEQETEKSRGALRGTAVHRVMECYDFASEKVYMNRWRLWKKRRRSLRICAHL